MTLLQAIVLGIVQGATEFLPISSSGHLVLVPSLLGWQIPADQAFAFDILLQAATLIAILSFFAEDFKKLALGSLSAIKDQNFNDSSFKLSLYLILATIPAGIAGLTFNGFFEEIFDNPLLTAYFLIGTAILLTIAEKVGKRTRRFDEINWKDSVWVGMFQILALFPGISRSGVTITGAMVRNLDRQSAARFSFLISVPLMIGAGINGFHKFIALPNTTESLPNFFFGSLAAATVGYISIKWLLNYLSHRSLFTFVVYCLCFASINLIIIFIG